MEKHNPAMVMLNYVTQQIHEGNYQVALAYGFNWDEIRALESLSHQEFHWLITQSPNFMEFEVRVNHQQTQMALQRLAAQKKTLDVQQRLLVAGAPRALMIQLFGWIPQHYCSQRKLLRLDDELPRGGRPTNPTLNEEEDILAAWDQRRALDLPERYLQTASITQVTLRQVCRALSLREAREREALKARPVRRARSLASRQDNRQGPVRTRMAGLSALV